MESHQPISRRTSGEICDVRQDQLLEDISNPSNWLRDGHRRSRLGFVPKMSIKMDDFSWDGGVGGQPDSQQNPYWVCLKTMAQHGMFHWENGDKL